MPLDVKGDETNEKESSKNIFPRNHFISLPLIITEEPRMSVHIIQIKALLILSEMNNPVQTQSFNKQTRH